MWGIIVAILLTIIVVALVTLIGLWIWSKYEINKLKNVSESSAIISDTRSFVNLRDTPNFDTFSKHSFAPTLSRIENPCYRQVLNSSDVILPGDIYIEPGEKIMMNTIDVNMINSKTELTNSLNRFITFKNVTGDYSQTFFVSNIKKGSVANVIEFKIHLTKIPEFGNLLSENLVTFKFENNIKESFWWKYPAQDITISEDIVHENPFPNLPVKASYYSSPFSTNGDGFEYEGDFILDKLDSNLVGLDNIDQRYAIIGNDYNSGKFQIVVTINFEMYTDGESLLEILLIKRNSKMDKVVDFCDISVKTVSDSHTVVFDNIIELEKGDIFELTARKNENGPEIFIGEFRPKFKITRF